MRADIHDGQEHKRSVQGPDTEAQDLSPPNHHFPLATRGRSIQKCQLQTSRQVLNKSGLRRIATGKCHRRRVVVRDASRRWDVNLVLPPSDESCKSRAQARRMPEKPELTDICTAG